MKTYRLDIRIKNNLILKRVEEKYPSLRKFCQDNDLIQEDIYPLINYKVSPVYKRRSVTTQNKYYKPKNKRKAVEALDGYFWSTIAIKLSKVLDCSPFEIFPEETWQIKKNNRYQIEVDHQDLLPFYEGITQGLIEEDHTERDSAIEEALAKLSLREAGVIRDRFFESKTLEEIGKDQGISRERLRQIEAKALRKLRHPSICRGLKEYGRLPERLKELPAKQSM